MTDRHQQLLIVLIREYIRTANAISSNRLADVVPFSASPATIRHLLRDLEIEGYLWQPHTSAGRIPTDAGYRLYVDSLILQDLNQQRVRQLTARLREIQRQYNLPTRALSRLLSELARTIAVSGSMHSRHVHEAGLRLLLEQPEASQPAAIHEVSVLLDDIDYLLETLSADESNTVQAFIGQENPVVKGEYTAIVARRARMRNDQDVFLLLIGPKRMPYEQHLPLLNAMATIIENT